MNINKPNVLFGIKLFKLFMICVFIFLGAQSMYLSYGQLKGVGEYWTYVGNYNFEEYNCTNVTFDNPEYKSLAQWHIGYTTAMFVYLFSLIQGVWATILFMIAYILYHTWSMREFVSEIWNKYERRKTERNR